MKIIEKLGAQKLSKQELKQINGGNAPECYGIACIVGFDETRKPIWECFPSGTKCPPRG
ncbi:bacteriocin [Flavobacterium sp.]|uniref:bacteriocin n=1 Tax=Flavobacterium sp. TaxID=239 RepID=UPI0031CE98BF